jgi:hypothetical protein
MVAVRHLVIELVHVSVKLVSGVLNPVEDLIVQNVVIELR